MFPRILRKLKGKGAASSQVNQSLIYSPAPYINKLGNGRIFKSYLHSRTKFKAIRL